MNPVDVSRNLCFRWNGRLTPLRKFSLKQLEQVRSRVNNTKSTHISTLTVGEWDEAIKIVMFAKKNGRCVNTLVDRIFTVSRDKAGKS